MDLKRFDKAEYQDIILYDITFNKNNLPFWFGKIHNSDGRIHRHNYIQIDYVSKGTITHQIDKEEITAVRGDIFVIPPYVPHRMFCTGEEPFEILQFEFTPEFVLQDSPGDRSGADGALFQKSAYLEPIFRADCGPCLRAGLSGALRASVEKLFEEILNEYQLREVNFELAVKSLTLQLLVQIGRAFSGGPSTSQPGGVYLKHREAMLSALQWIQNHFSEDVSPEDAARVALLSPSYFRCLFRQMTNHTFTRYVNELRVNKAIDLLKINPETHITDVCYSVGFNNINYFNRTFKQITGVSPKSYKSGGR